ncbi:uncharacterized protein VTP21DRAFT_104 [Calcarisporiella thermophila]|uniref:uncharacterized protein n=1 Tax=Calcarisporiella thermophila TaxID=911321 RepID=UPI0037443366
MVSSKSLRWVSPILLLFFTAVLAQNHCTEEFSISGRIYNLTALKREVTIDQEERTPPSITHIEYKLNPCAPLTKLEGVEAEDQCPEGNTYACRRVINTKHNETRVLQVNSMAGDYSEENFKLKPQFLVLEAAEQGKPAPLSLLLHGGSYHDKPLSTNITFICIEGEKDELSATLENDLLSVRWSTKDACPKSVTQPNPSSGISGFSIFMIIVMVIFAAYIILGMLYNYNTNRARGVDMIPHLEFWRDLPYIIRDGLVRLWNMFASSGRGRYSAL